MKKVSLKRVLQIFLFLVLSNNLLAQVKVTGKLTTDDNGTIKAVPFANVVLYKQSDTISLIAGAVSDFEGKYVLDSIQAGEYRLEASSVGYTSITTNINVVMPSSGNELHLDYQLEKNDTQLSEVNVSASRTKQYADKMTVTFTPKDIKSARYSKDLLTTLPELTIDPQTNKLVNVNGGSMLILVNGIRATDNELKLIPPEKVIRVEYYDIPPARYAQNSSVMNLITKKLDDGYNGGIDAEQAFSTGFGDYNAYFKYNSGRNQFSFEYVASYRDYKDRESNILYDYELNNEQRESNYLLNDSFGYTTHEIALRYTNQEIDNYTFQIAVKPNLRTSFSKGTKEITNQFGNDITNLIGNFDNDTKIFSPVVDIYYSKKFDEKSEMSFNLVGTMFNTQVDNENEEYQLPSMTQTLNDIMNLDNKKESVIGELAYDRSIALGTLSAGYRGTLSWLDSDISNYFGKYDYSSRYDEHYLYTELAGMKGKMMYRMGLGGTFINNQSYSNDYHRFVLMPKLILGYSLTENQTLRLTAERENLLPSVADLSYNAQLITPDIAQVGNPMLENATKWASSLIYTAYNKYIYINMAANYSYTDDAINEYFSYNSDINYLVRTKENADYYQTYGASGSIGITPFGTNDFSIMTNLQYMKQTIKSQYAGTYTNTYIPIYLQAVYQYKNLTLAGVHKFVSQQLSGAYLSDDENMSALKAMYRYKSLTFSASLLWLGEPSKYQSETYDGSLVYNKINTKIWDNKNMFVLGVSWNFSSGKEYKVKRSLNNRDTDSATF